MCQFHLVAEGRPSGPSSGRTIMPVVELLSAHYRDRDFHPPWPAAEADVLGAEGQTQPIRGPTCSTPAGADPDKAQARVAPAEPSWSSPIDRSTRTLASRAPTKLPAKRNQIRYRQRLAEE